MVDWNKIFKSLRNVPSVGMPGMHLNQQTSYSSTPAPTPTPPKPAPTQTPVTNVETPSQSQESKPAQTTPPLQEPTPVPSQEAQPASPFFFVPNDMSLSIQEAKAGAEALLVRLSNVTSCFEAPINPETQMPDKRTPTAQERAQKKDIPLLMPATRFYWCKGDKRPGLTVGYGTFFQKKEKLTPEDQSLLPSLQILNRRTQAAITGNQPKANVIHGLFPHVKNDSKLKNQPYYIPVQSADAMLFARFCEKSTDLDRLLSNKGKRVVQKRDVLVDWVASDLYYQGALSWKTGTADFAANNINKQKLSIKPNPKNLRLTARRTCADLKSIIDANPFTPQMNEDQRQAHAQKLSEYCTAYTSHQMTRANPAYYYTRNHVQAHIQDISSLAIMDIARSYYGRDLTKDEIYMCTERAADISRQIFSSKNPQLSAIKMTLEHESEIKNPMGHYRADKKLMAEAKKKEQTPTAQASPKQNPSVNQPNLTASLKQSGQVFAEGDLSVLPTPSKEMA